MIDLFIFILLFHFHVIFISLLFRTSVLLLYHWTFITILIYLSRYFVKFALLTKFHLSSSSSFKNGHIVITAYHHLWWLPVLFILISIHNLTPLPSGSYESILTWNPFLHLHLCIKSQSWLRILFTTLPSIFKKYFKVWFASLYKLYPRRQSTFLLFLFLLSLILQLRN